MSSINQKHTAPAVDVIVDRVPTWATSVDLEADGYVAYTLVIREDVEIQQSAHVVVDQEAGTVGYQTEPELQLWLRDLNDSISPETARRLLADLQDLLAVVDGIEAAL